MNTTPSATAAAALALPLVSARTSRKLVKATTPPPRKAEIIEALARRKLAQLEKEARDRSVRIAEIRTLLHAATRRLALAKIKAMEVESLLRDELNFPQRYWQWSSAKHQNVYDWSDVEVRLSSVKVSIAEYTAEERRLAAELEELTEQARVHPVPRLIDVKRQVRDTYEGLVPSPVRTSSDREARVDHLLADPDASKALDAMLKAMDRAARQPALPSATTA